MLSNISIAQSIKSASPLYYLKNVLGTGNVDGYFSKHINLLNVLMQQYQEDSLTTIKPFKLHFKEKHLEGTPQAQHSLPW
jgi:hypothetical protein